MSGTQPLPIVMYASPTCEDSELARDRLRELGVPFAEVNLDEDPEATRYVEHINNGFRSTPTIVFGDEAFIVVEPTVEELDAALRRAGYGMVGMVLADELDVEVPEGHIDTHADPETWKRLSQIAHQAMERIDILAAGLNHFTWMLDVRDKRTGDDLYPLFADRWASFDLTFEPLTRRIYQAFGWFPIPGDEHLCEYLPWVSDPITKPWEKYDISLYDWDLWDQLRGHGHEDIARMADGRESIDHLRHVDSEGALEIIENVAGAGAHYHLAVNLPNQGYITNLPAGAIVEVPGVFNGAGVHGVGVGPLPEPIAELCRREITVVRLCVDAAIHGDRQAALQCLLLDPVITDLDVAWRILDDYLATYREHLPQFW